MLILPHSTELSLAQRPYVTYAIVILCLIIHFYQDSNRDAIAPVLDSYCESIFDGNQDKDTLDILRIDTNECESMLDAIHFQPDKGIVSFYFKEENENEYEYTQEELDEVVRLVMEHYEAFRLQAPTSLDAKLMYSPSSWNPFHMVTSALSHGDWWHIIFNLIFFMAIAPALEILVGHPLKYIGVILLMILATHVTYSLSTIGSLPIPTLGLSGVVMGMIGLSAYLMPNAKIRTFVWFFYFARNVYIPAWILAVFYIAGDVWDMLSNVDNGGVNLVAHVSGGVAGYLIGLYWFKARREETREELAEEIDFQKSLRHDKLGMLSSHKGGMHRVADQQREHFAKKAYNSSMDRIHSAVATGRDSEAIILMLENYELYGESLDIYDELFNEFLKWRHGRALLCLGRLNIELLLESGKTRRALDVAQLCHDIADEFVLARPSRVLEMVKHAVDQQMYSLAWLIVHDAEARYGHYVDPVKCQMMEAWLLWKYLNRANEAKKVIERLSDRPLGEQRAAYDKLAGMVLKG